jgi:hypothetical protein
MLRLVPVKKLSRQMTSWPAAIKRSQRCEPRNPAPPVTNTVLELYTVPPISRSEYERLSRRSDCARAIGTKLRMARHDANTNEHVFPSFQRIISYTFELAARYGEGVAVRSTPGGISDPSHRPHLRRDAVDRDARSERHRSLFVYVLHTGTVNLWETLIAIARGCAKPK